MKFVVIMRSFTLCGALAGFACEAREAPDGGVPTTPFNRVDAAIDGDAASTLDAGSLPDSSQTADTGTSTDASQPDVAAPEVELSIGRLQGKLVGSTREFLGVPYALAPVGELRFAPPKEGAPWSGQRQAQAFGAACPQATETGLVYGLPPLAQSEDCLFLNVYAPAAKSAEPLPVMVWIHGGSGVAGSGAEYDGRALSETGNVIVVTLNYRLGALSSLALPELDKVLGLPSGNLALRDQQLALQWVHDHIAGFGGDASNVTLFGESAGAITSCLHMFLDGSRELITRFILQSGGCVGSAVNPATRAQTQATSMDFVKALCGDVTEVVACLRSLSTQQVLGYTNTRGNVLEQLGALHVDGQLLTAHPNQLAKEGKLHPGPVLLGSTRDEVRFLAAPAYRQTWPLVKASFEYAVAVPVMYPDIFLSLFAHYGMPSDAQANDTLVNLMNDGWFRCPARALARSVAARGGRAYLYSFDLGPAVHTQEIDYVFGFSDARVSRVFEGASVPPHPELMRAIQKYWINFARTGDPGSPELPAWPYYKSESDQHLSLNAEITVGSGLEAADCDFWNELLLK